MIKKPHVTLFNVYVIIYYFMLINMMLNLSKYISTVYTHHIMMILLYWNTAHKMYFSAL